MKLAQLYEARYAGSASEKTWWDFVDHAQWTKDYDYDRIMRILRGTDPQVAKELEEIYRELYKKLHHHLDDKVTGVSDDGYSDLLAHIIGSGKKVYYDVMNDWKVAQGIVNDTRSSGYTKGYKEGFQYIWHYEYDD